MIIRNIFIFFVFLLSSATLSYADSEQYCVTKVAPIDCNYSSSGTCYAATAVECVTTNDCPSGGYVDAFGALSPYMLPGNC